MRIVASPLLVAVALGLLGPGALDEEEEEAPHTDVSGPALDGDHALRAEASAPG